MQFSRLWCVELADVGPVWLRLDIARTIEECIQHVGCVDTMEGV